MPRYIIEGPDGKRYEVEGPAGAAAPTMGGSPTQAPTAAPEASQPYQRAGGYGPVMAGLADAGIKGYLGIKGLFGGLDEGERAVLQQQKIEADADPNPYQRMGGEIAGNVATLALPGVKAEKALRGVMGAGRLATAGAAVGAGAGTEFITAPGGGDTYGEQMASKGKQALIAGGLGGTMAGVAGAIAKPFQASPEAEKLISMGITPTLQQGAESRFGRMVGGLSGGAGAGMVKDRQNQQVMAEALRRITPGVDYANKSTSEAVGIMDDLLTKEYDSLLTGKIYQMTPTARGEVWKAARTGAGREADEVTAVLREMGDISQAIRGKNNVRFSPESLSQQRERLQDAINLYSGPNSTVRDKQIRSGLVAAKNKFDETVRNPSLSSDEAAALRALDSRYKDSRRVMEAAASPEAQKQLKVSDMLRAYKKLDPTGGSSFAKAEAPMQRDLLEPAARTMDLAGQDDSRASVAAIRRMVAPFAAGGSVLGGATLGGPAVGVPLAIGYGTSLLGQTEPGAKMLMGQYGSQKKLAELLRKGGIGTGASASMNMEDY